MKDKEIHKLLEVALTLKIPIAAVVADVTVTVAGEPDGATAENLVYAFRLSRKTRQEQPTVDARSSARAAACDFQAFMLRGLIDVLAYLSIATEVTGQYLGGEGSHK